MTPDVEVIAPQSTIREAAQLMDEINVGSLPVCDGRRLLGMVTDRDITIRATAAGKSPDECLVEEVMSEGADWCFEDEAVEDAMEKMQARQIRRLPVVDRDKMLVGIISLGDLAVDTERQEEVAETLERISDPAKPERTGTGGV